VTERRLTWRERNRTLLARQLLLDRSDLTIPRAVERIGGVQAQYAPSTYVGLWSRLVGFARDDLTAALRRRTVVQGTLMRGTIHVVSRGDYPSMAAGVRTARRAWVLRSRPGLTDDRRMRALARRLRTLLVDGPLPRRELTRRLGVDATIWNALSMWVDMVRVPPSGTWERRSADLYGLADEWIEVPDVPEAEGIELLVRRYLAGFGPSSRKEIAGWSGLPVTRLDTVVSDMRLRRFAGEEGEELLDVPRAPIVDGDASAPVRFLPTWDATLLINERATRILPEHLRPLVFNTKTPHSVSTFLVDGQVAGTWRSTDDRIVVEPFERLARDVRRAVDEEAERLARFHREGR
jgi:DNA glycosylase AlkZ-like